MSKAAGRAPKAKITAEQHQELRDANKQTLAQGECLHLRRTWPKQTGFSSALIQKHARSTARGVPFDVFSDFTQLRLLFTEDVFAEALGKYERLKAQDGIEQAFMQSFGTHFIAVHDTKDFATAARSFDAGLQAERAQ